MTEQITSLFYFLENFDIENNLEIMDEEGVVLFSGKVGDVPQRISNRRTVVPGSVINHGDYLSVKVTTDN